MTEKQKKLMLILGITVAAAASAALLIAVFIFSVWQTNKDAYREYTEFGSKEKAIVQDEMGITLSDDVTPERLTIGHGGGDYCYQLWVRGIDDPEEYMAESFSGSFEEADRDKLYSPQATDYGEGKKTDSAAKIYSCALPDEGNYAKFDYYYIAFYEDGGGYCAKVFADKI